jgi:hypothetical protein
VRNTPLLRKATLFIPTGPRDHLHVVMNDAVFYPVRGYEAVLAINLCSITAGVPHDSTCELGKSDHRFVVHPTFADYRHAGVLNATRLQLGIANGELRISDPVSEALYQRILDGFSASPAVTPKLKRFIHFALKIRI